MNNTTTDNKKKEILGIVIVFAIMLLANIFGSKAINALFDAGVDLPLIVYGTVLEALFVVPAIVYIKIKGEKIFESLGMHKIRLATIPLTILLTVLSVPLYSCANALSQVFVPNTLAQASEGLTSGSVLGTFIVMVIAAPICEEIALRGFCFNRFSRVTSLLISAVISAIMFGVLHLNINQMCYAIVLGVVFAYADYASGSIFTSMIMHALVNSVGVVALLVMTAASKASGTTVAEAAETVRTTGNGMLFTGFMLLIISIGCIFLIRKVLYKIAEVQGNREAMETFGKKKTPEAA